MVRGLLDLFMDFANVGFRYIPVPDNEDFFTRGKSVFNKNETTNINLYSLLINEA